MSRSSLSENRKEAEKTLFKEVTYIYWDIRHVETEMDMTSVCLACNYRNCYTKI